MQDPTLASGFEGWQTPPWLFRLLDQEFGFELDAAADDHNALCRRYYTQLNPALCQPWAPFRTFCNPPRSVPRGHRADAWVEKAIQEARAGALVVMLLRVAIETDWFRQLWETAEIRFLRPRVRYWRDGRPGPSPTFPSFVAVLRPGLPPAPEPVLLDVGHHIAREVAR